MYVCMYVCMYICMYVCVCVYIYIYIIEAGLKVTGDLRVNGVLMSKPVANIACTAERAGSIRWNDKYFESCDGVNDWQPIQVLTCSLRPHILVSSGLIH